MKGLCLEASCPVCGGTLTFVARGSTNGVRTQAIVACPKCPKRRREFRVTVVLTDTAAEATEQTRQLTGAAS